MKSLSLEAVSGNSVCPAMLSLGREILGRGFVSSGKVVVVVFGQELSLEEVLPFLFSV